MVESKLTPECKEMLKNLIEFTIWTSDKEYLYDVLSNKQFRNIMNDPNYSVEYKDTLKRVKPIFDLAKDLFPELFKNSL